MMCLNLVKELGLVLQIAEGWTVDLDPGTHHNLGCKNPQKLAYQLACAKAR
jgi:hypothetical protein